MSERRAGLRWLLAAPLGLYLAVFLLYPSAYAVKLAFTDSASGDFPSLTAFRSLWRDRLFWQAAAGNLIVPALSVALELLAGLGLALLLAARMPARGILSCCRCGGFWLCRPSK